MDPAIRFAVVIPIKVLHGSNRTLSGSVTHAGGELWIHIPPDPGNGGTDTGLRHRLGRPCHIHAPGVREHGDPRPQCLQAVQPGSVVSVLRRHL